MKKNQLVLGILAMASTLTLNAAFAERVTLKLAHNLDPTHVVHQALETMAKEAKEKSNGEITIRIYPSGQMGGPRETIEMLQNGALDMTKASASEMESFAPAYSIFSLPYLFKNQKHFDNVLFGDVGHALMQETKEKGFTSLAAYVAGTRSFYAKKAIKTPEDMKGLKFRVVATPTTIKLVELLGASPAPISFGEVYTALQQGVIDGAENNEPSYVQTRHVEVAKFYSEDQHTYVPDYLVISNKALDKLSEAHKTILLEVAKNSEKNQQALWYAEVEKSRADAIKMGATFVEVDKEAFRTALKPLYEDFKKDTAKAKWIDQIEAVPAE